MEWTSGTGERHVVEWDDTAGMLTSSRCLLLFYSTKINSEELGVGVIVLDSVDALVPMAEMQEELDSDFIGVLARKLSRFCRRITPMLKRYGVDFFAINQILVCKRTISHIGRPEIKFHTVRSNALLCWLAL